MGKRARKRRRQDVSRDQFHPSVAKGLTFAGEMSDEEALQEHYTPVPDGGDRVAHLAKADVKLQRGVPYAAFVAENSFDAVFTDGVTDRPQMDYRATYTPEGLRLLREGRQCLRCQEPLEPAFPLACPLCGYSVKDRQIMDIGMEFEGERHLGPAKPVSEWMIEQEARKEKRKFARKALSQGGMKIPKSWERDAVLLGGE